MAKTVSLSKTNIRVSSVKVRRAQKALGTKTEIEAIERALDWVIAERNRMAIEANERFIRSGVEIKDLYGKLDSSPPRTFRCEIVRLMESLRKYWFMLFLVAVLGACIVALLEHLGRKHWEASFSCLRGSVSLVCVSQFGSH